MIDVFKFGGASVKDANGVKNLANIIRQNQGKKLLIVISAMGKTTNQLEELTHAYIHHSENIHQIFTAIKKYHEIILNELFENKNHPVFNDIANTFVEIDWLIEEEPHENEAFVYDQIVSIGELVSTKIVSSYLSHIGITNTWLDARSFIHTDNTYKEGQVNWDKTNSSIKNLNNILLRTIGITQGFIGGTSENYTTTLGREGSDYSAAIFASCLKSKAVTIWKDVPGVLTADPKLFPHTTKYDELSYTEALEMTYYGATVIHPKTIKPLQNANIPLYVKPLNAPQEKGTIISSRIQSKIEEPALIVKSNQLLLSITTKDFSFITENHLSDIFKIFAEKYIKINMTQISAISFSACIDYEENKFGRLMQAFTKDYNLKYNTNLELITIRHFKKEVINEIIGKKTVLLEQFSRNTAQLILKSKD